MLWFNYLSLNRVCLYGVDYQIVPSFRILSIGCGVIRGRRLLVILFPSAAFNWVNTVNKTKTRSIKYIILVYLDCKTVRIFAYSSTREQSNKRFGTRLKTESETGGCVRLARVAHVRLLRHALLISLLILRKNDCFAVYSILGHTCFLNDSFQNISTWTRYHVWRDHDFSSGWCCTTSVSMFSIR